MPGVSPAGFDLAHLVLSAMNHVGESIPSEELQSRLLGSYLEPLSNGVHWDVTLAFASTVALTAISRLCWTLNRTAEKAVVDHWARLVPWILATSAAPPHE